MRKLVLIVLLVMQPNVLKAKVLFEGYYKIEQLNKHIGFVIQRDEIEEKSRQRTISYLLYKNQDGNISQDGVKVTVKEGASPHTYLPVSYTNWLLGPNDEGSVTHGVADLSGKELIIKKTNYRNSRDVISSDKRTIPPGSEFSSMTTQIVAERDPSKYRAPRKMTLTAFSEEDARYGELEFNFLESRAYRNIVATQIVSHFLGDSFELFTFADGQSLGSRDETRQLEVYLVKNKNEAVGNFRVDSDIRRVFGDIPLGLRNPISETAGGRDAKIMIRDFASPQNRLRKDR